MIAEGLSSEGIMKIITQRQLIRNVAKKWRQQYEPFNNNNHTINGKTKKQIAEKLDALDKEAASAVDVAEIIGNESWTMLKCDECKSEPYAVIRVGEEPDYESQTACLCFKCAKAACEMTGNHERQILLP